MVYFSTMFADVRGQRIGELFDWWVGQDLVPYNCLFKSKWIKMLGSRHICYSTVLSARNKMMHEMFDVLNAVKLKL